MGTRPNEKCFRQFGANTARNSTNGVEMKELTEKYLQVNKSFLREDYVYLNFTNTVSFIVNYNKYSA